MVIVGVSNMALMLMCVLCSLPCLFTSLCATNCSSLTLRIATNFIVSCHGARRRSPPLLRAPRRGRPTSANGAVAGEATVWF